MSRICIRAFFIVQFGIVQFGIVQFGRRAWLNLFLSVQSPLSVVKVNHLASGYKKVGRQNRSGIAILRKQQPPCFIGLDQDYRP